MWREIEFPLLQCVVSVSFDVKITRYDKNVIVYLPVKYQTVWTINSSVGASFSQDTVVKTRISVKVSFVNVEYLKICDVTATSQYSAILYPELLFSMEFHGNDGNLSRKCPQLIAWFVYNLMVYSQLWHFSLSMLHSRLRVMDFPIQIFSTSTK